MSKFNLLFNSFYFKSKVKSYTNKYKIFQIQIFIKKKTKQDFF